jgi:TPR repeat protein
MHQHGEGLSKDFFLAKRYYDQAAALSSQAVIPVQVMLAGWLAQYVYENGVPFEWITEADWSTGAQLPEWITTAWTPPEWMTSLQWDSVMIAFLCIMLAVLFTIRQRL